MGFEFADDELEVIGRRAVYFPSSEAGCDSKTLGYQCTVTGQIRSKSRTSNHKQFLVQVANTTKPTIADESELIFCKHDVRPTVQSQGELIVTWQSNESNQEMVGTYRANHWLPRSDFVFHRAEVSVPRYGLRKSEDGHDLLIFEAPLKTVLDVNYVVIQLGKITGQLNWRVLPRAP